MRVDVLGITSFSPTYEAGYRCPTIDVVRWASCQADVPQHEIGNGGVVIEIELRQSRIEALIARDCDDIRVVRVQQRFTHVRSVDFELGNGLALEALDQHQVAR